MTTSLGQPSWTAGRSGAVYLLPHAARQRFKVGWSVRPLQRARNLPEGLDGALNLSAAHVAWFRETRRARQVERSLLRGLAPYSVDTGHRGDGCTEWFHVRSFPLARRMLTLLAATDRSVGKTPLLDLGDPPPWGVGPAEDVDDAGDIWSNVEDLWRRLTRFLTPVADPREGTLLWPGMKRLLDLDALLLRSHVADPDNYSWRDEGGWRSLVSTFHWDGDDLLLQLTPARQLRRWTGGDEVVDLLRAFLIQHTPGPRR